MSKEGTPGVRAIAFVSCCLIAILGCLPAAARTEAAGIFITADELAARLSQPAVELIDVRAESKFTAGHLPTAVRLPEVSRFLTMDPAEARLRLGSLGLDGSETAVLYGDAGDEADLGAVFFILESAGTADVKILEGGTAAWLARGGSFDRRPAAPEPARFTPVRVRRDTTATAEQILSRLGTATTTVVDVRVGRSWQLYEPPPAYVAGHVPTALPYAFSSLWQGEVGSELRENAGREFARLGPRAGEPVDLDGLFILYGSDLTDTRTGLGYLTLRALGLDVRVYRAGWSGWVSEPRRPIVEIIGASQLELLEESDRRSRGPLFAHLPIFDLREMRDWEVGHVPGAFPLAAEEFPRFLHLVLEAYWPEADPLRDPLVVYCYGPACTRSLRGIATAVRVGWRTIYWFREGVGGWYDAGFALERLPEDKTPWDHETGE